MSHGKLDVYVEGALHIKDTTILGKGSPYCTLTMGTQEFSSPPVPEGGTCPYFNTKFEFQVDRTTEQLMVRIFSKKTLADDDLLGYCTIVFKHDFSHSHVPVTPYALTRPSGRPGGHIQLSLAFKSRPRPAPPLDGYMPPQPAAGPYRQPRPVGPPPGAQYRQPRPPPQQRPPQNYAAGPSANPPRYDLPRRMNEDNSSQSSRSDSDSDDGLRAPGPYVPATREYEYQQPPPLGRGRGRGGPRPPGPFRGPAPPPPNNVVKNFRGALGVAFVGSAVGSDGDGSDWGDGDDESYGQVETASHGSAPEEYSYYANKGAVEEVEYAQAYEVDERAVYGNAVGAPVSGRGSAGPPAAGVERASGRGRAGPQALGRGGPPGRTGPPAGRPGMRGRGPPFARGGPPPMARGGPPPMARGGPPPMARGGPPPMARGGPPPMRGRAVPF